MDLQTTHSIANVFSSFSSFQSVLLKIYDDTISYETHVEGNRKLNLDDKHLRSMLRNKLALVILGQNYATKCKCVNWLIRKQVLPVYKASWIKKATAVTIRHSTKSNRTFALSNDLFLPMNNGKVCSADMCQNLADFSEQCLFAKDEDNSHHANIQDIMDADVEICLDAAILQGNVQIILKDFDGDGKDQTRKLPFKKLFQNVIPVFIFALSSDALSTSDTKTLTNLKKAYENCAVLFWKELGPSQHLHLHKNVQNGSAVNFSAETNSASDDLLPTTTLESETCACDTMVDDESMMENRTGDSVLCSSAHHCEDCIATDEETTVQKQISVQSSKPVALRLKKVTNSKKCLTGSCPHLQETLESLGFYFSPLTDQEEKEVSNAAHTESLHDSHHAPISVMCTSNGAGKSLHNSTVSFFRESTLPHLTKAAETLNKYHEWMLDEMIYLAFALSRNVMITPKKMHFAYQAEEQLYKKLLEIATHKQAEIMQIIEEVKLDQKENILESAETMVIPDLESDGAASEATSHIQNMVLKHIKNAAAEKLSSTIDVLRETMTGILSRCIESLQLSHTEGEEANDLANDASAHLKMILNAAYYVEVSIQSSSSLVKMFIDKIRKMLRALPWKEIPIRNASWKRMVAEDVLNNICENRLAKTMCTQFQLQLQKSHDAFLAAMRHIEERQKGRIKREQREIHNASKIVAPKVAQLVLRSRSVLDEILYGTPVTNKEIGRGSYGVVFACSSWPAPHAKGKQCAVKSVVPPDQKHLNDLALEFYYSVKLPPHPRIVQLFGSVVDYAYGEGLGSPAVLLVMERMLYDLHRAIEIGMPESDRMLVSLDVIEGIRYLHSQGLVHRDIKLRNILLDTKHRAKISDLGFCKPSAMISGSIVGTPVHMPPELFSGQYDSSVDVYAFGILFWHLCAGTTTLPKRYTQWSTKDHLWNAVKQGVRPEYRPDFRDDCWALMQQCWVAEPAERPIPGIINDKLLDIMKGFEGTLQDPLSTA